ncbi:MAG: nickel pincer cofactor biosynthesis protein LarC [Candidatus Eremiobacteraeota bacterium]|nr:nickel pincer cofactor biosynthesis protein LarC [Candidatus Eremiobacteraeota bacterium]
MKIAYFDCFSGASGNMILGALVDAGLPLDRLERELRKLPVPGFALHTKRVDKRGLAALYLDVDVPGEDGRPASAEHEHHDHHHEGIAHRRLADVLRIVRAAQFPSAVETMAEKIYRRLAVAEARVHGTTEDAIAFHEVGQVDAIVDIAGAAIGLFTLGIDVVHCSPLPCGRGRIRSAHGEGPSPAPATLELLRDAPTYALDVDGEFVTPTGAAILSTVATFEPRPAMTIDAIGYGAGSSDFPFPNVLRVVIGETVDARADTSEPGDVVQLETNIDDMNPQLYEHVIERLFAAGALDVWTQAVVMKKGRPGTILASLAQPERADAVAAVMLAETTSIGVRQWIAHRTTLPRRVETVTTALGPVRVKIIEGPGGRRVRPEYDDVRGIAQRAGRPLAEVMASVERDVSERLHGD